MSIWAIVPVKPFLRSKSRLAGVLSPEARAGLSREFLGHALRVLGQVPEIGRVLVVSRDPAALRLARDLQAHTVTEAGAPDPTGR
jgi:2-phospho-L-lactate guanylyltransferase